MTRELKKFLSWGSMTRGVARPLFASCLLVSGLGSALVVGAGGSAGAASRDRAAIDHSPSGAPRVRLSAGSRSSEQPRYVPPPPNSQPNEIIRVAGGAPLSRFTSGVPAIDVALSNPGGVAVNSKGDLFIADTDDNEVREVAPDGIITTIAGNGIAGFSGNGHKAVDAELDHPEGVAVDSSGDVFIADTGNDEIREVTGGVISDYAGDGVPGDSGDGGLATDATLTDPYSVAVGPNGELAIGDTDNNAVRLVYRHYIINGGAKGSHITFPFVLWITTIAGGGVLYGEGNLGTDTYLSEPTGVAFDSAGNVFVADTGDSDVREISEATGDISTVAYCPYPNGVAVDSKGNLFIADPEQQRILELPSGGSLKRIAGSGIAGDFGDGGTARDAQLDYPAGLAVDGYDDVFIADTDNSLVREVVAPRVPYFYADSPPLDAGAKQVYYYQFGAYGVPTPTYKLGSGSPSWLGIDKTTGQVLGTLPSGVTTFSYSVVASNSTGSTTAGPFTVTVPKPFVYVNTGLASYSNPFGLAEAGSPLGSSLFVADSGRGHVVKLSSIAQFVADVGTMGTGVGQLKDPTGVAVDGAGNIWVVDDGNDRMEEFSGTTGHEIMTFGFPGSNTGEFDDPAAVVFGPNGNMYVSDSGNDRIEEFTTSGSFVTSFGSAGNGPGQFEDPAGLAFTSAGVLLVADYGNNRIEAFTSFGLYIGKFGKAGSGLGQFDHPFGVAVDSAGDIFVTDRGNNRVEEFSSTAEPIDQFGTAGHAAGDLEGPTGIGISSSGILSVVDTGNKRVEQFAEPAKPVFTTDSPPLSDAPKAAYSYDFHASGEPPPTYSLSGAPAWLSINSNLGDVTGTPPSQTLTFSYSVVAKNASGATTVGPFTVTVSTPLGFIGQIGSYGTGNGELDAPIGVAVAPNGNYYVVDRLNNRIEEFSPSGTYVRQFGTEGTGDGQLDLPVGIAADPAGDIWVTDYDNSRVEEFSSTGAYMSQFGSFGPATGEFDSPEGIAIDPTTDDVYVADTENNRVQEFSSSGTFIHQFTSILTPVGVAVTPAGEMYTGNDANGEILGYNASDVQNATYAGAGSGPGEVDGFSGMAVDSAGNIWVSDYPNERIEEFSSTGAFVTQFGSFGSGNGEFEDPEELAVTSSGIVLVADLGNDRIDEFQAPPNALVYTGQFGTKGTGNGDFEEAADVAIGPNNDFYTVDYGNNRIEEFSPTGKYSGQFGTSGSGTLDEPAGIAFDSLGDAWVTDEVNCRVVEFSSSGTYMSQFGTCGSSTNEFDNPVGIAIDPTTNDIFVADEDNNRVEEFSSAGTYITEFRTTSYGSLSGPIAVAVTSTGELYIADSGHDEIVGFDTSTDAQNVVFGAQGSGEGQFEDPTGLAADSDGNVWVSDADNSRVEEFSSIGTYLSQFGAEGSGDGELNVPVGLCVSSAGVLSVADLNNNRVEQFGPAP
ncbi:MAG: putative Ig domain-containing protein [Acidimicrobiales bacterium]